MKRQRLCFKGNIDELKKGIHELENDLGYIVDNNGLLIKVIQRPGDIKAEYNGTEGLICFERIIHFYRALGLFLENLERGNKFSISEQPQFLMNGVMVDCSRNAVLKVAGIQALLRKMAVMGLDMMMLYTEDTYEIKGEPYFGYMRGRYTQDELIQCDDYAYLFGIEMIPCIQVLAHLKQFLRWRSSAKVKDTSSELLVGSEETYQLIEKMVVSVSQAFRSNRIHIGMDESISIGLGRYLKINGYRDRKEIFKEHLNRVAEILKKYKLRPIIWGDMLFEFNLKNNESAHAIKNPRCYIYEPNTVITKEDVKDIPKEIQIVYWRYAEHAEEHHRIIMQKYKNIGFLPIFAGGIHIWGKMTVAYNDSLPALDKSIAACKKEGIKETFVALWSGDECNFSCAFLGLQYYAELCYCKEMNLNKLKRRVRFCTGVDYEAYMKLSDLDDIPKLHTFTGIYGTAKRIEPAIEKTIAISKLLLWQDLLIGLYDKNIQGLDVDKHYADLEKDLEGFVKGSQNVKLALETQHKLCSVLAVKSSIGVIIKKAYDEHDIDTLKRVVSEKIPAILQRIIELRSVHQKQWMHTYKPFGWEVFDIRYGGLLARTETAKTRLEAYIEGKINKIEELEEERLPYDSSSKYSFIVTANSLD